MFLLNNVPLYVGYWCLIVTINFLSSGKVKWKKFRFSERNYYAFVLVFLIPVILNSVADASVLPLVRFLLLGLAGVVGETLVSIWWHAFFGQRLWVYAVGTVYHKYTSWLNFIPWAVGGSLYLDAVRLVGAQTILPPILNVALVSGVIAGISLIAQLVLFRIFRPERGKFHEIGISNIFFMYGPVVILILILGNVFGNSIYLLTCYFGLVATTAEYLFGKATEFFISKKMWTYTYVSFDRGHFTPLSIPLFALGGFYFWYVGSILHLV